MCRFVCDLTTVCSDTCVEEGDDAADAEKQPLQASEVSKESSPNVDSGAIL